MDDTGSPNDPLLTYKGMADLAGVSVHTMRSYASRKNSRFPPADTRVDNKPLWKLSTYLAWDEARLGQGWRGATRP